MGEDLVLDFFLKDGEPYGVHQFFAMNTGGRTSSFEDAYVMLVDQTPEFPPKSSLLLTVLYDREGLLDTVMDHRAARVTEH